MPGNNLPYLVQRFTSSMEVNLQDSVVHIKIPNKTLAGNCLILDIQHATNDTTTPSINSVGPNPWVQAIGVTGNQRLSSMITTNCDAGTSALDVTFGAAVGFIQFEFEEWANVSQSVVATALDGTPVGATTVATSPVASGSITTTQANSLVKQFGSLDAAGPFGNIFTKGSGFTLIGCSRAIYTGNSGVVAQYTIKTSAGAINPTFTYSGTSNAADTVGYALKSGNFGTLPAAGIRVAGVQQTNIANDVSVALQFPHVGTLIVITDDSDFGTASVTDGDGNSYVLNNHDFGGQMWVDEAHAKNVAPNTDMTGPTITWSSANVQNGFVTLYDIVDAAPDPFVQHVSLGGTQSVTADLDSVVITPQTKNALIITKCNIISHTVSGLVAPTAANGGLAELAVLPSADGAGTTFEQDNGQGHWYNGNSLGAQTFTWSIQHNTAPAGVGGWGSIATEFKTAPEIVLSINPRALQSENFF